MPVEWSTACLDWQSRIIEKRSLISFSPLFPKEASSALDYLRDLHIVDAIDRPTFGQSSRAWFIDFAASIFGAYDAESGRRLIREFFLLISKKNGKSTDAAAIMLTALLTNWRDSAEYLIMAPTLEIANNSFYPTRDMIRAGMQRADGTVDPLDINDGGFLRVQDNIKTITDTRTGATLKVIAADSDTVSGKKATGVLVDELWLFGKRANAENMLLEATGGLASRPEGFTIYLSTQSDEPPKGVFKQKLNYFRDVRDGKIEDRRSLGVIYEFPQKMVESKEYLDPKWWFVTNPNLGLSVDEEFIASKILEAENLGQESLRSVAAKHLNVEISQSLRGDRWAGADFWENSVSDEITLDWIIDHCEVVIVGIDGGGLDDLFSLYVIGRASSGSDDIRFRKWYGWGHSWAFSDPSGGGGVIQRRKQIVSALKDFERAGELTIFEEPNRDVNDTVDIIRKIYDAGLLAHVCADPAGKSVASLADALELSGMVDNDGAPLKISAVTQGYKLQGAIGVAERELVSGKLVPAKQAIMAWAVGNAKMEIRGNAVIATKQASGSAKIDPLMALFDAVAMMSLNPEPRGSVYSADRGLIAIG